MMTLIKSEEGKEMEKRKQWSFRMTQANTWSWRAVDASSNETLSAAEFDTLAECIVNAKQHGYVVLPPNEERRTRDMGQALE
jgi:hypothetical protein